MHYLFVNHFISVSNFYRSSFNICLDGFPLSLASLVIVFSRVTSFKMT